MGKSFRHNDIAGICGGSDKKSKQFANRRLRRKIKENMKRNRPMPLLREVSNEYDFQKDGKVYFGNDNLTEDELRKFRTK